MSKYCYLACRTCADERMNSEGYNWAHRTLHHVAQHAPVIAAALDALAALKCEVPELLADDTWRIKPWWLQQHRDHALYVVDEYGREWPCQCRGNHTGECRPEDVAKVNP